MKDNIEIQQEFEKLLDELSKLRSINQLITENTDNSKRVVSKVDSIVEAMRSTHKLIESDFEKKSKTLSELIDGLNHLKTDIQDAQSKALKNIDQKMDDHKEKYETSLKYLNNNISKLDGNMGKIEGGLSRKLEDLLKSTTEIFNNELDKTNGKIIQFENQIVSKISDYNIRHSTNIKEIHDSIQSQIKSESNNQMNKIRLFMVGVYILSLIVIILCILLNFKL